MTLLAVEHVDAGYGRAQVLEDVSVRLSEHETVAVLGPNGSGKSTLVKTVMGLTTLHRGRIAWKAEDIGGLPVHARTLLGFGYVPQTQNIFPALSVLEPMRPPRPEQRAISNASWTCSRGSRSGSGFAPETSAAGSGASCPWRRCSCLGRSACSSMSPPLIWPLP